ncbi:MAG: hypothetical protein U5J96_15755 [Ignavibacteriaceae bacterium]|nr:hypothetical protein [Ignavibacteriaceae bacterium]
MFLAFLLTEIGEIQNTKKIIDMALQNFASEINWGRFEGEQLR